MVEWIQNFMFGVLCIMLIVQHDVISQTTGGDEVFEGVELERTEVRTVHSEIVGRDYEIMVSLPPNYFANDTATYPVIILLDAYRSFAMIKGMTEVFITPHSIIPEVVIVGIGYGGTGFGALLNWVVGRTWDLTPVKDSVHEAALEEIIAQRGVKGVEIETGGAPLFLEFIRDELFPFIASNYRVDLDHRMLSGYSFGGLFALYTLFRDPGLFHKYHIGSPSISFGNAVAFEYETEYSSAHRDLKAEVFMSSGELEQGAQDMNKMAERLHSRNFENLILETAVFKGEGHVTAYPASLSRGLVELFNNDD